MTKKNNINILFLGGAKRVSMAEHFIKAGTKLNKSVQLFSYELNNSVPIASVAKIIKGHKWKDKKIISHLIKVIKNYNIDIVVPFVDPSTIIAAKLNSKRNNKTFIPVCGARECDIFFDKIKANEWFVNNNFPVPIQNSTYPVIAKPKHGSASAGITILKNVVEYNKFIKQNSLSEYLIQRFIFATEYSVDCYVSPVTKKIISIIPRKRIETTGGEVTKTITVNHKKIIHLSTVLLQKAELVGSITIQFLEETKTNDIYIMEVNPRFGGGAPASITAGANTPLYMLNDYLKKENEPLKKWKNNLLMVRAFREFYI